MKEKIVNIYTHMTVNIMWNWIQRKDLSKWNEQIKTARDWLFVIGWFPATAYKSKITLRYQCLDNLQSRTCVRVYGTWNGLCLRIIWWTYILLPLKGLCFILYDYIILDYVTDNMLSYQSWIDFSIWDIYPGFVIWKENGKSRKSGIAIELVCDWFIAVGWFPVFATHDWMFLYVSCLGAVFARTV